MKVFAETARLILRGHRPRDLRRLHSWQNDVALLALNASTIQTQSLRRTATQLRRWMESQDDAFVRMAVELKATGALIGFAQLAFVDRINRNCKVGLTIGERDCWNLGLGTELISGLAQFAFSQLGLHRMVAEVYETNGRAVRAFEKVGFLKEGIMRDNLYREGRWVNEFVFGLLEEEWARSEFQSDALPAAAVENLAASGS